MSNLIGQVPPQGTYSSTSENIINELQDFVFKTRDENQTQENFIKGFDPTSGETFFPLKNKILPPPGPEKFSILSKPGVHRYIARGCWGTSYTPDNCDTFPGSYCGRLTDDGKKDQCFSKAPGGLADFTYNMPTGNDQLLKWGFIIKECECSSRWDELTKEGCPNLRDEDKSKYVCSNRKKDGIIDTPFGSIDTCCNLDDMTNCMNKGWEVGPENDYKASGEDPTCSRFFFPDNDYNPYQTGELGTESCGSYRQFPIDEKESTSSRCKSYLQKWAYTCDWCKKRKSVVSPDASRLCVDPNSCPGKRKCASGEYCENQRCPIEWELPCNICDASLWDWIPGGWEAIIDENHPYHKMANLAYIPKSIEADASCPQPKAIGSGGILEGVEFELSKSTTTFIGLNPNDRRRSGEWSTNNNSVERMLVGNNCTKPSLYQNSSENPRRCDKSFGPISVDKKTIIWNTIDSREEGNYSNQKFIIKDCNFAEFYYNPGECDDTLYIEDPRSHLVCQRNPNLTGIGECENETSYLAELWLNGEWDINIATSLTEPDIVSENLSEDELNKRKLDAARCCLGLSPDFEYDGKPISNEESTKRYNLCRYSFTAPGSKACQLLYTKIANEFTPQQLEKFGQDYPEGYSLKGTQDTPKETMEELSYYTKAYCTLLGTKNDIQKNPITNGEEYKSGYFGYNQDIETLCRKIMYNYCTEDVTVENSEGERISYPLRMFDKKCNNWCSQKLKNELPDQEGVCDIAIGRTCQQLQVDGFIFPDQWNRSELIKWGNGTDGLWTQIGSSTNYQYDGLELTNIKNTCSCFLMGAFCNNDNCSISYCGAGDDTIGKVSYTSNTNINSNEQINRKIFNMNQVYNYNGENIETPQWESKMQPNFTCYNSSNIEAQTCFQNCNYVNQNDTCWMASPKERLQNNIFT